MRHLKCIEISSLTQDNIEKLKSLIKRSVELQINNRINDELRGLDELTKNENFIIKY